MEHMAAVPGGGTVLVAAGVVPRLAVGGSAEAALAVGHIGDLHYHHTARTGVGTAVRAKALLARQRRWQQRGMSCEATGGAAPGEGRHCRASGSGEAATVAAVVAGPAPGRGVESSWRVAGRRMAVASVRARLAAAAALRLAWARGQAPLERHPGGSQAAGASGPGVVTCRAAGRRSRRARCAQCRAAAARSGPRRRGSAG